MAAAHQSPAQRMADQWIKPSSVCLTHPVGCENLSTCVLASVRALSAFQPLFILLQSLAPYPPGQVLVLILEHRKN